MRGNRLNVKLSELYGSGTSGLRNKKALEAELLSRYRKLHPQNRRWLMLLNPWNRTARFVLTGLALCVIVIGACTTDTITDVDLGKQMKMDLAVPFTEHAEHDVLITDKGIPIEDLGHECKDMSKVLIAHPLVEDASVSLNRSQDGQVSLDIMAWGEHVEAEQLVMQLRQTYPFLADASVTVNDLKTTIKESYASKIGRKVFKVEASGTSPEELRRQFLEQLEAQGYNGHADIIMETDGDQRSISIELEDAE